MGRGWRLRFRRTQPDRDTVGGVGYNDHVLLAGFEVPGGISVERPKNNLDKFLSEADYVYGRMLPRGDEHGARGFDMLLAKQGPFPSRSTPIGRPSKQRIHARSSWGSMISATP